MLFKLLFKVFRLSPDTLINFFDGIIDQLEAYEAKQEQIASRAATALTNAQASQAKAAKIKSNLKTIAE